MTDWLVLHRLVVARIRSQLTLSQGDRKYKMLAVLIVE